MAALWGAWLWGPAQDSAFEAVKADLAQHIYNFGPIQPGHTNKDHS